MCGINGFNWNDESLAKSMNEAIKHRGPDDQGVYSDENMSLGQVRLSIIDLSPAGHQPMFYSKEKGAFSAKHQPELMKSAELGIVFNGEIYNFQDIKTELEQKGYQFSTKCDTEVILAGYLEWGTDCVKKFNGMWAFCIYDKKNKLLFCSRDRLGVKPFYYYYDNDKFIFSSELKGILVHKKLKLNISPNINKDAIELYFTLGFVPSPYSVFNDVYKLEPSQNIVFDISQSKISKKWKYYTIPEYNPEYDPTKLLKEGRKILNDAVKIRMIADVPVGAFLSGGLDSTTIVGVMKKFTDIQKLHTFSIGFEGKYDESKYMIIAKDYFKTVHHHHYFTKSDFNRIISIYPEMYDEPFGDYSGFPTYMVSEIAKKYVTVTLTGDGGDEIFGGYNLHLMGRRMDIIRSLPKIIRQIIAKIPARKNLNSVASLYLLKKACEVSLDEPKNFFAKALEGEVIKNRTYKEWTSKKLDYALKKGGGRMSEGLRIYDLLFNTLADNFLVKVDRASMFNALESRSPFLDYRFIEFGQKIPAELKVSLIKTKVFMREMIKDIIPKKIMNRGKWGFRPPIDKWINDSEYKKRIINSLCLLKNLNPKIYQFYSDKLLKQSNESYDIYKVRLFIFGLWWERWIKQEG